MAYVDVCEWQSAVQPVWRVAWHVLHSAAELFPARSMGAAEAAPVHEQ